MLHWSFYFEDQGPFTIPYFGATGYEIGGAGISSEELVANIHRVRI